MPGRVSVCSLKFEMMSVDYFISLKVVLLRGKRRPFDSIMHLHAIET